MDRIQAYFAGKVLLITGATGFVGRVLVEKLLRDLPEVRRIYLLMRPKAMRSGRSVAAEERLDSDFLSSSVFHTLREHLGDRFLPLVEEKLVAVPGDLGQQGLGLAPETYRRLQEEVQVIINSGAMVTFDAAIDAALRINTRAPLQLLEFAQGCRQQPILVHVSTCYVSGTRQGLVAEEPLDPQQCVAQMTGVSTKPYDVDVEVAELQRLVQRVERSSRRPWRRLFFLWRLGQRRNGREAVGGGGEASAAERRRSSWVDRQLVAHGMRRAHRRGWNDVYTFTKAMGEQLLARHRKDLAVLILRPSIIESSLREPVPGWLDGLRMVDPFFVAYGRNQLLDFPGDPQGVLDVVPVDKVVNALLAAVPGVHRGGGLVVCQVATGTENPITVRAFADLGEEYFRRFSLLGRGQPTVGLPHLTFPPLKPFLRRMRYRALLPLRAVETLALGVAWTPWGRDLWRRVRARRAGLLRIYYYARIFGPYGVLRCQYVTQYLHNLWDQLNPGEQERFNFNVRDIFWPQYIQQVHIPGLQRYVLGVTPKGVPSSAAPRREPVEQSEAVTPSGDGVAGVAQAAVSPAPAASVATAVGRGPEDAPGLMASDQAASPSHTGREGDGAQGMAPAMTDGTARTGRSVGRGFPEREVRHWQGMTPWGAAARAFTRGLFGLGFRFYLGLTCQGLEHVPKQGAFLVASNHNSHVDTAALLVLLGRGGRPLHPVAAKDYFFSSLPKGWVSRLFLGAIPFDRYSHTVESLGLAVELLRRGHALIFFPEGGRSSDGRIRPFKRGIGFLAVESGAPVVPVYVEGSFLALPKGGFWLHRHPVRVRIGPPISVEPYLQTLGADNRQELARRITEDVQRAVLALAAPR